MMPPPPPMRHDPNGPPVMLWPDVVARGVILILWTSHPQEAADLVEQGRGVTRSLTTGMAMRTAAKTRITNARIGAQ